MTSTFAPADLDRRAFLSGFAISGAAAALASCALTPTRGGPSLAQWHDKIGLQLFTVRDHFEANYEGMLKAVADIGYRHVETTRTYGPLTLDQVKPALERNHLTAIATRVSPPSGPQFEPTLDAYARIGHRYTTPPGPLPGSGGTPGAPPQPLTAEAVKRTAAEMNAAGVITKKHGLKIIAHNTVVEFDPLADRPDQCAYDILLAETDPDLVAMELDIGWAAAAGVNSLDLFRRAPGRFEIWHMKDVSNLRAAEGLSPEARKRLVKVVPLGLGEIDYRPIFAAADQAGLRNFYFEQEDAATSGNSLDVAASNYQYMSKLFV